ncbi:hypothetical protein [Nonomuraea rubra]|uniref:Uncharacterized protein n=1 Tax=Nonomuraea rubra TaxID=46180 RepID=A0A7X0NVB8_9ACTN|nr:hypothetical protein [Nonomuraea rubra]MBB6550314.1 hypothetical protein [Nonomuraea rubra]
MRTIATGSPPTGSLNTAPVATGPAGAAAHVDAPDDDPDDDPDDEADDEADGDADGDADGAAAAGLAPASAAAATAAPAARTDRGLLGMRGLLQRYGQP